jgi:tRNA (cytidine/uridine-2'-O-)-methyltransferase
MIHIVLVEPEIPQNTGNIARTCAALGAELHLVHPLGFKIDEKKVRRAGLDYWNLLEIHEYDDFSSFLSQRGENVLYPISTKAAQVYSDIQYSQDPYIIFGKETKGLEEDFIRQHPDTALRIPMHHRARSLNLSNAVAIVAYEVARQQGFSGLKQSGELS